MDPIQGTPGVEYSFLREVRVHSLSLFPQSVEKVSKRVTQRLGLTAKEENDIFLNSSHQPGAAVGLEWNTEKEFLRACGVSVLELGDVCELRDWCLSLI